MARPMSASRSDLSTTETPVELFVAVHVVRFATSVQRQGGAAGNDRVHTDGGSANIQTVTEAMAYSTGAAAHTFSIIVSLTIQTLQSILVTWLEFAWVLIIFC
jgi:hypothetical protein